MNPQEVGSASCDLTRHPPRGYVTVAHITASGMGATAQEVMTPWECFVPIRFGAELKGGPGFSGRTCALDTTDSELSSAQYCACSNSLQPRYLRVIQVIGGVVWW